MTMAPTIAVSQATPRPIQRRCHMPRKRASTCSTNSCMVAVLREPSKRYAYGEGLSKPALRDQQDIARLDIDVGGDVAALDQILQPHAVLPATLGGTHDRSIVAVREIGQAAHDDHQVQKRHPLAIRQRLRLGRLTHDPDLLGKRSVETPDNYRDE